MRTKILSKKNIIQKNTHKKKFKAGKLSYKSKITNKLKKRLYKVFYITILIITKFFLIIKKNKEVKNKTNNLYETDDVTLVTGLFQIDNNRHKFEDYFIWVNKLLQINKPIIFFTQSNLSSILKEKRPKKYDKKTIFIEKNISEFYSYKNYLQAFKETYIIDIAKFKHTVELYIVWSEKVNFLNESIEKNYFKSKYFFWVDAGLLRKEDIIKFVNDWPCIEKLKKDPRVILNGIRKIKNNEYNKLMNFDIITHYKFMNDYNVAAGFFGGRYDYLKQFIKYYYEILELFYKNKVFIGSEQNLFTIVGYSHPEIVNIINSGDFDFLKNYLLPK